MSIEFPSGELRQLYRQGQEDQLWALGMVLNEALARSIRRKTAITKRDADGDEASWQGVPTPRVWLAD
jgi:hypothetical protein